MKLTNKQKTIIRKSLKLNEDFFDDFNDNDIINNTVDDSFGEPGYTYNIYFIIYMFPLIKNINRNGECVYYFENPKYKPIIESGFLSMKKALDSILQATPIVTDYSKPKFCSSSEKIIKSFPFITNNQSNELEIKVNDNQFIILKTSINLSRRKNVNNLTKLFYSFWRLQQIYQNTLNKKISNKNMYLQPYINICIGVYKNNSYKKSNLYQLMPYNTSLTSYGLELINLLNNKDETN